MNLPPQIVTLARLFSRELAAIREKLGQIRGTIKQHVEAVEKERHRQNEREHIPTEVRAEVHFPDSIETKHTAYQNSQHTMQKVIAVAAWGAFIAALAYATVAALQFREMREQTAQLYRQAEVENAGASHRAAETFRQLNISQDQAKAALDQAGAAAKNAKAAEDNVIAVRKGIEESSKRSKEALDATISNFHQEQRAWLGLDVGSDPDHPIKISELTIRFNPVQFTATAGYRIKNFGHGPAFAIATEGFITTDQRLLDMNASFGCQATLVPQMLKLKPPWGSMLFPNGTRDNAFGGVPGKPFPAELIPNATVVFFIGCITYKDQFDISHWTRFCFTTSPYTQDSLTKVDKNTPLVPYAMYNDTDDNQQKAKE